MRWIRRSMVGLLGVAAAAVPACGGDADVAGTDPGFGGSAGAGGSAGTAGTAGSSQGGTINIDAGVGGTSSNDCPGGCPEGQFCSGGVCVTQAQCADDNECQNDTHCDPAVGCVPWGPGESDPTCQVGIPPGNFAPSVKCEFSQPPAGDPYPNHVDVQATPMVVNFSTQSGSIPSIIAPFTYTIASSYAEGEGIVRVLRGDDCTLEANLGGGEGGYAGFLVSSAPVAVGDVDGVPGPEVIAKAADGRMVAFSRQSGTWDVLWVSPNPVSPACSGSGGTSRCGNGWAGPSIHNLDDGPAEIIVEGSVLSGADGSLLSGNPPGYATFRQGLDPVLANMDGDANIELTNGQFIWEWNTGAWVQETYYQPVGAGPGFVAVADFGAYGAGAATDPEIVLVRDGIVDILATDGSVVLASVPVPGGGGGSPTVSDYDGDGLPEVGIAGEAFLTVYDIDCTIDSRVNGTCDAGPACDDAAGVPGPCPNGVLWSRRTQDISSNVTGSSVFDFEDDGKAEVVYADECFVRVYDGTSGDVRFSQYRSSCTWYENPIVADTDGDFRADLVTPSNLACSDGINGKVCENLVNGVDPQFPGLRCLDNSDCVSGNCDSGLCRCTATAQCCSAGTDADCLDQGLSCVPPPVGTPGGGSSTCRAAHPRGVTGIRVYHDDRDRWVRSRTIWSQHAYAVTHINEDGSIPLASGWAENWLDPDLNNFRQNVPGTANGQSTPDLTAGASGFSCSAGNAVLRVPVCNRGAESVGAGITVGYYVAGTKVCEAATTGPLAPGECETVSCTWNDPPTSVPVDVTVFADDGAERNECREENNQGTVVGVVCDPPA